MLVRSTVSQHTLQYSCSVITHLFLKISLPGLESQNAIDAGLGFTAAKQTHSEKGPEIGGMLAAARVFAAGSLCLRTADPAPSS